MKSNKLKELLINSKTISFTIIIIVGVLAWVGNQQMKSYEDSILSIYDIRDLHLIHFFPETVQTIFYKIWQ